MTHLRTPLMPVLVLFSAACGIVGLGEDEQLAELEDARELWAAAGPADYRFEFFGGCFCAPEFTQWVAVTVESGQIVSVEPVEEDGRPIEFMSADDWLTVEELFELIERNLGGDTGIDWEVVAVYDATLGYPIEIGVSTDEPIADAGLNYRVREFVALGGAGQGGG